MAGLSYTPSKNCSYMMQYSTRVVICVVLIIVFTDLGKCFFQTEASYVFSVCVDANI